MTKRPRLLGGCLSILFVCGVVMWISVNQNAQRRREIAALPTLAVLMTDTVPPTVSRPTNRPAPTATPAATNTPAPTATITETALPTPTVRPTDDATAIIATADAIQPALVLAVQDLPDLQVLRSISAMHLEAGWYVSVVAEIAPADDNEFTMPRIFEAVETVVQPIASLRVETFNGNEPQNSWLWEGELWKKWVNGDWQTFEARSSGGAVVGAATVTPLPIPIRSVGQQCPANCTEAVALGWTEAQAGTCGNLDRDNDGKACYGD